MTSITTLSAPVDMAIIPHDFPDPSLCGNTLFASMSVRRKINIQTARVQRNGSVILENRDALPLLPMWTDQTVTGLDRPWAPHVYEFKQKKSKKPWYVMYFCAQHHLGGKGIGIAVSPSIESPFTPLDEPLVHGKSYEHIDPFVDIEPVAGTYGGVSRKKILYWGSAGTPVKRRDLSDDGVSFARGSEFQSVLFPDPGHPINRLFEAPVIVRHGAASYMLISGPDTFGEDSYCISISRLSDDGRSFVLREHFSGYGDSVILRGDLHWKNPGHPDVFVKNGRIFIIYHAMLRDDNVRDRMPLVGELIEKDGWLEMKNGNTPSESFIANPFTA